MAGNRKSTRKPSTHRPQQPRSVALHLPMLNLPPSPLILKQAANGVKVNLNKMITGEAKMVDWMNVLHRIHVGFFAAREYLNMTDALEDRLCTAIISLRMIKIRVLLTAEFGVLVNELDKIVLALDTTEDIMRMLSLSENLTAHRQVAAFFEDLVKVNQLSYPPGTVIPATEQEKIDMVATLKKEMAQVSDMELEAA